MYISAEGRGSARAGSLAPASPSGELGRRAIVHDKVTDWKAAASPAENLPGSSVRRCAALRVRVRGDGVDAAVPPVALHRQRVLLRVHLDGGDVAGVTDRCPVPQDPVGAGA